MMNIRVELHGELLEKFKKIQGYLGIENATETVRFLITDYYRDKIEKQPTLCVVQEESKP